MTRLVILAVALALAVLAKAAAAGGDPGLWRLVSTVCAQTGPGRAECRVEVSRPYRDGPDCWRLSKALREYLEAMAAESGAPVVHITTGCERGLDG